MQRLTCSHNNAGKSLTPRLRSAGLGIAGLFLVVFFCVWVSSGRAGRVPGEMPDFFPAEEAEVGMRGVGFTSLRGGELQEFEFEILGVLRSFHPQGRVFLVELEHPELEESGVISGMSGSPLYIDDRLLGAVAYGFQYSMKPIAGVTPAGEMWVPFGAEASESPERGVGSSEGKKALGRENIARGAGRVFNAYLEEERDSRQLVADLMEIFVSTPWPGNLEGGTIDIEDFSGVSPGSEKSLPEGSLRPLPVPLSFSGVDISRLKDLNALMQPGGLFAVEAPEAEDPGPIDLDDALVPGTPVGVVLMSGDIDIAGMGTLTFSDGERVAAFGHPMTGMGETDLPMAIGHVETVVPSRLISFRLTSSREIIGSVTEDRQSAIVGKLGREAPMFPARVKISGFQDAEYEYKLAGHWQFAPMMSLYAAVFSALRWESDSEMVTVTASSRLKLEGRDEPLILENTYAFDPLWPAFELVLMPVQSLMLNPFEDVKIESLDIEFNIEEEIRAAEITSVELERYEVQPGEELSMRVVLREFHGPAHVKEISLQIPEDAVPGRTVGIRISDALTVMASAFDKDPGLLRPESMDGLIESLEVLPENTRLYVAGDFIKRGLRYEEEKMPALPGSVMNMLEFGLESGKTSPLLEDVQNSIQTPWVLRGTESVRIKIKE